MIIRRIALRLIFPKSVAEDHAGLGFCLTLGKNSLIVNFPQVYGPESHVGLGFCLTLGENHFVVNFPQVCGREAMQDLGSV